MMHIHLDSDTIPDIKNNKIHEVQLQPERPCNPVVLQQK